jgi:hypothetical protein
MIICFNYCDKDADLALSNAELIRDLGKNVGHKCVIMRPKGSTYAQDIHDALLPVFDEVTDYDTTHNSNEYPAAANWSFLEACYLMQKRGEPWFFFEADCCPVKRGWVDAIVAEYNAKRMPMLGHKHDFMYDEKGEPFAWRHMTGAGVYPADMFSYVDAKGRNRSSIVSNLRAIAKQPWDTYIATERWHTIADSETIRSRYKVGNYKVVDGKIVGEHLIQGYRSERLTPTTEVGPELAVVHNCKDTSLIECVRAVILGAQKPAEAVSSEKTIVYTKQDMEAAAAFLGQLEQKTQGADTFCAQASSAAYEEKPKSCIRHDPIDEIVIEPSPPKSEFDAMDWTKTDKQLAKASGWSQPKIRAERKKRANNQITNKGSANDA